MNDKEKEFVKKVNIDKSKNKTTASIVLMSISLFSYILPLIFGDFDFGLIFEILTLVFIFLARHNMEKYNEELSKKCIVLAMIPLGWLLIYDFITMMSYVTNVLNFEFLTLDFLLQEGVTIWAFIILYQANKCLNKADNPEKYKESTDWFYERLDKKEEQ